ncbi:DUF3761 domain-containing protein [Variovorax sp. PAMC 28711]|uniref:DUF3761 domain-containing protein n=1 Tax=Variovorax sp. PAMC 28711 TaxID=1795631 RepID=UPI00078C8D6E|nr:DUF3761 domain-containing protein [Variovorax sp. PAMC 28711]AMM24258.1 hypothetical protein AX767_07780 [Variovorax sp. PAMC 28711]
MTFASTRSLLGAACLALTAFAAQAQVPADAPAGTTVRCKDDSYASPDTKSGACRGHKGIKTWYGKADATPAPAAAPTPAVQTQAAAVSKTGVAPSTGAASRTPATPAKTDKTAAMTAAPGGGAGKVWANDETKVYHCMGDRYYGKTKKGEYLSEADAKAKGMHASHNKACTG